MACTSAEVCLHSILSLLKFSESTFGWMLLHEGATHPVLVAVESKVVSHRSALLFLQQMVDITPVRGGHSSLHQCLTFSEMPPAVYSD